MTELEELRQRVDWLEGNMEALRDALKTAIHDQGNELEKQGGQLGHIADALKRIMLHFQLEPLQ